MMIYIYSVGKTNFARTTNYGSLVWGLVNIHYSQIKTTNHLIQLHIQLATLLITNYILRMVFWMTQIVLLRLIFGISKITSGLI